MIRAGLWLRLALALASWLVRLEGLYPHEVQLRSLGKMVMGAFRGPLRRCVVVFWQVGPLLCANWGIPLAVFGTRRRLSSRVQNDMLGYFKL